MIKNLTTNQLILIAIATVLLLLAAFSFYLLQDLSAPLPFAPPAVTSTFTSLPTEGAITAAPSFTSSPTRQTSYTPFASILTPDLGTPPEIPIPSETAVPGVTISPSGPTNTATTIPTGTATATITPTSANPTPSPTATETLSAGEYLVTGRVIQNGTPIPNLVVEFEDDVAPRLDTTASGGHYSFISLAPGTSFSLTFNQGDNPQLIPTSEVASLARIEGNLPTGVNTIDLPDLEVSVNLNGMIFELQTPIDNVTYSATAISPSNPIQFTWLLYSLGGSYHVELGPNGSDNPIWTSIQLASPNFMWDGTLDDGSHISVGAYWWRVAATKSLANYGLVIFTQRHHILFNP